MPAPHTSVLRGLLRGTGLRGRLENGSITLAALAALMSCGRRPQDMAQVPASATEMRQLTAAEIRAGVQVHLEGIIRPFDRLAGNYVIEDSTGGVRVELAHGQIAPDTGWRVLVTGLAGSGGPAPSIVGAHLRPVRAEKPLPPPLLSPAQWRDPRYQYRQAALAGIVRSADSEHPGLIKLAIRAPGGTAWAMVPASMTEINDLVDAEVQVTGVLAEAIPGAADPIPAIWTSGLGSVAVMRPAAPSGTLPVTPIGELLSTDPQHCSGHRVRVEGTPRQTPSGGLALWDGSGRIPVLWAGKGAPPAESLDIAGFLEWDHRRPLLTAAAPVGVRAAGKPALGPTLTTALSVRSLPLSAARLAYPVRLRAVVTYADPLNGLLFVQDATDAVFVELSRRGQVRLRAGDEVEVAGVTVADFAPNVDASQVTVVGHPGLPAPGTRGFGAAALGQEDSNWIQLQGIVLQVNEGYGDSVLTLAWGRETYQAHVLARANTLASLVDAEVRLSGVCDSLFNSKRQFLRMQLLVPGAEFINVEHKPAADPFALTPTAVTDLMRFSRVREKGHRLRLRGVVTYADQDGAIWVRDGTGGVMIRDHNPRNLAAGDLVDVVGFPAIEGFSPMLRGAQVRKVRSGEAPVPIRVTAQDALQGDFDGQLIELDGKIVDQYSQPGELALAVESGSVVFDVSLPRGGAGFAVERGMVVRLSGICTVETAQTDSTVPRAFRLLARSPEDLVVLSRPPWLTPERVVPAVTGLTILMIAALTWVGLLRRRVNNQTHALRAQTLQLHLAHQRSQDALHKVSESESLHQDTSRILALIARDEPVGVIADQIAEAVAMQGEDSVCAVMLGHPAGLQVYAVPALPAAWLTTLEGLDINSISCRREPRPAREFCDAPAWARFMDQRANARFESIYAEPIQVEGVRLGAIAGLFRHDAAHHSEPLAPWCQIAALALERRRLHDELSYRAQHDLLTGLPNRAVLYERLEAEIALASRRDGLVGVLYIDLNGFKAINDTYGHAAGDAILKHAAGRMIACVRQGDTVARVGGDEFVVLLPRLARREDAQQIAGKLAAVLSEPADADHRRLSVSASVGVGIWPLDGEQADPLLRFADAQMYGEKRRRWYESPPGSEQFGETRELLPAAGRSGS